MFYVVFIIAISLGAWPLRTALRSEDDPFGGGHSICGLPDRLLALILYGTIFLLSHGFYLFGVRAARACTLANLPPAPDPSPCPGAPRGCSCATRLRILCGSGTSL